MGDGEKLLTHLNSALKVLLGLDIFPRVPKKKLNFVDQCNVVESFRSFMRKENGSQAVNEIVAHVHQPMQTICKISNHSYT